MFGTVLMAAYFGHSDYVGLVSVIWISFMIGNAIGVTEVCDDFHDVLDDIIKKYQDNEEELFRWRKHIMSAKPGSSIETVYTQLLINRDLVEISKLLKAKHKLQCTGVKATISDTCEYDAIYFDDIQESILVVNDIWYHMCESGYVRQMTEVGLGCYLKFLDEFTTAEAVDINIT
ncbi:MAG: hypothetical protein ACR2MS_02245 [Weeksellaceae bacterium]